MGFSYDSIDKFAFDKEYSIKFEQDKDDKAKIDYEEPDYGVNKTKIEKTMEEIRKKNAKDEFPYSIKFDKDLVDLNTKKEKAPHDNDGDDEEPIGDGKSKKMVDYKKKKDLLSLN